MKEIPDPEGSSKDFVVFCGAHTVTVTPKIHS